MKHTEGTWEAEQSDQCPECQGMLGREHHGVRDCEECGARFDAEELENGEVS